MNLGVLDIYLDCVIEILSNCIYMFSTQIIRRVNFCTFCNSAVKKIVHSNHVCFLPCLCFVCRNVALGLLFCLCHAALPVCFSLDSRLYFMEMNNLSDLVCACFWSVHHVHVVPAEASRGSQIPF